MNWIIKNCSNICTHKKHKSTFSKNEATCMLERQLTTSLSWDCYRFRLESGFKLQNEIVPKNLNSGATVCETKKNVKGSGSLVWCIEACSVQTLRKMSKVLLCTHVQKVALLQTVNWTFGWTSEGWLGDSKPHIPVKRQYSKEVLSYNTKARLILNNRQKLFYTLNIQYLLF